MRFCTLIGVLAVLSCQQTLVSRALPPKETPASGGNSTQKVTAALPPPSTLPKEIRAVWLTHYEFLKFGEAGAAAVAQDLKNHGINTVYLAMYSEGRPFWASSKYMQAGGIAAADWAKKLFPIFKNSGLRVAAWFEYGFAIGSSSAKIAIAHPDWLQRDKDQNAKSDENNGMVFLSPGVPAAVDYIVGMVEELAAQQEWDEIQLDRFRWTRGSTGGREFGYEKSTLDDYNSSVKVQSAAPDKNEPSWVRFRETLVNTAMNRAYRAAKTVRPSILVSSAPLGYYGITQHMQRWSDWLCGNYLDLAMPQMYEKTLSGFQSHLNQLKSLADGCNKADRLGAGLDASAPNDVALIDDQIRYATNRGVRHITLWAYHTYDKTVAIRDNLDALVTGGHAWAP